MATSASRVRRAMLVLLLCGCALVVLPPILSLAETEAEVTAPTATQSTAVRASAESAGQVNLPASDVQHIGVYTRLYRIDNTENPAPEMFPASDPWVEQSDPALGPFVTAIVVDTSGGGTPLQVEQGWTWDIAEESQVTQADLAELLVIGSNCTLPFRYANSMPADLPQYTLSQTTTPGRDLNVLDQDWFYCRVVPDNLIEGPETFIWEISIPLDDGGTAQRTSDPVILHDADRGTLSLPESADAFEGRDFTFTLSLLAPKKAAFDIVAEWEIVGGTVTSELDFEDNAPLRGQVTIPADTNSDTEPPASSTVITIPIRDDEIAELPEVFDVRVTGIWQEEFGIPVVENRVTAGNQMRVTVYSTATAPTNVTATGGMQQVRLTWDAPALPGGFGVTGYRIEQSVDGAMWPESPLVEDTGSTATSYTHPSLTDGQTVHYRIAAINPAGPGDYSATVSATTDVASPTAPEAPTDLAARGGDRRVFLDWRAPTDTGGAGITGYKIWRSTTAGMMGSELVADTGSDATSYTDRSQLTPATTYHYQVAAIGPGGTGTASAAASATTDVAEPTLPGSPVDLTAIGGPGRITVRWAASENSGGAAATGYRVERSRDGQYGWAELTSIADGQTTAYTHTGLGARQTVHYRVTATNSAGAGPTSRPVRASTDDAEPAEAPDPPSQLRAVGGEYRIILSWRAPSNPAGSSVTGYRVERSADGTDDSWTELVANTGSVQTTYVHRDLGQGETVHYQVSAISSGGTSEASAAASATTNAATSMVPTTPEAPTVTGGIGHITVSWTAPANNGSAITAYEVQQSITGMDPWDAIPATLTGASTSFVHSELAENVTVHYRVLATNAAGNSEPSESAAGMTSATPPELPPAPLHPAATGHHGYIEIEWTLPNRERGNPHLSGFRLEHSADGNAWRLLDHVSFDSSPSYEYTYHHVGLGYQQTVHYRITSLSLAGESPSVEVQATAARQFPVHPSPPIDLQVERGNQSLSLSWSPPLDPGGTAVTAYRVEVSTDGMTGWTVARERSLTTRYNYAPHQPPFLGHDATRYFRVSAINAVGVGPPSLVAMGTSYPSTAAPLAPPGNIIARGGDRQITVTWEPPTDTGNRPINGYYLQTADSANGPWSDEGVGRTEDSLLNDDVLEWTETGLTPGQTVYFRLRTENGRGDTSDWVVVSATTDAASPMVPEAPASLTPTAGIGHITLNWTAPANDGGASITHYTLEQSTDSNGPWIPVDSSIGYDVTSYEHTGLSASQVVYYQLAAVNPGGTGATVTANATTDTAAPAAPGQPTGLAFTPGLGSIMLLWNAPNDTGAPALTGYHIEQSADGGTEWDPLTDTTGTTYTHAGLIFNYRTHYRVAARNVNGLGDFTDPVAAHALSADPTRPTPPLNLVAIGGTLEVELRWDAPSDDGKRPITGYRIERSDDGVTNWMEERADTGNTNTSFTDTGLTAGQTHHYRVAAINAEGHGPASAPASATTDTATTATLSGPTNIVAVGGYRAITVTWTAPAMAERITGYRLHYSESGSAPWTELVLDTGTQATTYVDEIGTDGTTRHYQVRALSSKGEGIEANSNGATTDAAGATAPGQPTAVAATDDLRGHVVVTWTAPSMTNNATLTGYRVQWSEDDTHWEDLVANTMSTATRYVHRNLSAGQSFYYRVAAISSAGIGTDSDSDMGNAVADAPTFAPAPTDVRARGELGRVELSWTAPGVTGDPAFTGMLIEQSPNGRSDWAEVARTDDATITTYTHHGLAFDQTVHYRLSAYSPAGTGPTSTVVTTTTQVQTPAKPGAPINATAAGGAQTISLSWAPSDNNGGAPIMSYRIETAASSTPASWTELVAATTSTDPTFTHSALGDAQTQYYRVFATNVAGTGPPSAVVHATTNVASPMTPGRPTALTAVGGAMRVDLSWTAPVFNGGGTVTGYRIQRNDTVVTANTGTTATTYADEGLDPGQRFTYRVAAVNASGNGSYSFATAATTFPDATQPPDPPTELHATGGRDFVQLSWKPPRHTGTGSITGYQVEQSLDPTTEWRVVAMDTGSAQPAFTHTEVPPNLIAYYRVAAISGGGAGLPSISVRTATTGEAAVTPDPPRALTARSGGSEVTLAWSAPDAAGNPPLTGYELEHSADGMAWTSLATALPPATEHYVHRGLGFGQRVYYRAFAISAVGRSLPSNAVNVAADTETPSVPGKPTGLTVTGGIGQFVLRWSAPSSNGGAVITGYEIERSQDGMTFTSVATTTERSYTDTRRGTGEMQHFQVRAINSAGASEPSDSAQGTTQTTAAMASGPPLNLHAVGGVNEIHLTWRAPLLVSVPPIHGYRVEHSATGTDGWQTLTTDLDSLATSYTHPGLGFGDRVHYRIFALNAAGDSAESSVATAATYPTNINALLGKPTGLRTFSDDRQIRLRWNPPGFSNPGTIAGYRIEVTQDAVAGWRVLVANTRSSTTEFVHTGLDHNQTWLYRVKAISILGAISTHSTPVPGTTALPRSVPPGPPVELTAAGGPTQITLRWSPPHSLGGTSLVSYQLEQSADGMAGWTPVPDVYIDGELTEFTLTGLTAGETVHYRMFARSSAGVGPPSTAVSATTDVEVPTAPAAPTGLTAVGGTQQIVLTWRAPSNTGGAAILGYRVQTSSNGMDPWTELEDGTGFAETTYTHSGLMDATTYHYQVSTRTATQLSDPATAVSAQTNDANPTIPGLATALSIDNNVAGQLTLTWSAPLDSENGGAAITGYRIERADESSGLAGTWDDIEIDTMSTTTTYTDSGLTAGNTYWYRVSAINPAGAGNANPMTGVSGTVSATPAAAPGAPANLMATGGLGSIALTWEAPTDLGEPATILGYKIEHSPDGTDDSWVVQVANTGSTTTSYTYVGLGFTQTVHFQVSAINAHDAGMGATISATSLAVDPVAPGRPLNFEAEGRQQSVALTWTAPSTAGESAITGYRIEYSLTGDSPWMELVANTTNTDTTYDHADLTDGQTLHYRVYAINTAGVGPASSVATAATNVLEPVRPSAPRQLSATGGATEITLRWQPPSTTGGANITAYRLDRSADGRTRWSLVADDIGGTARSYVHTGLTADETVHYRLHAINAAGVSTPSNAVSATTDAATVTVPGAPANLTATGGARHIQLRWEPPSDNGDGSVQGYRIERSADGSTEWTDVVTNTGTPETTYRHAGLGVGETVHYQVSAINSAGTGMDTTDVVSATTDIADATAPGIPTALQATGGVEFVDLSWTAPADNGGAAILGYRVEHSADASENSWATLIYETPDTAYRHRDLAADTTVHYRVRTINPAGASEPSETANATTTGEFAVVPGVPRAVAATGELGQIQLQWTEPRFRGRPGLTGYRIELSSDPNAPNSWQILHATTSNTVTEYTHANLGFAQTRFYRVAALSAVGAGPASDAASATTIASLPTRTPSAPQDVTLTPGVSGIDVQWSAPTDIGDTALIGYQIERSPNGQPPWTDVTANTYSLDTRYSISDVEPVTRVYVRVSAVNGVGPGTASTVVDTTTFANPPGKVIEVTATAIGTSIVLDWAAPADLGGGNVVNFQIQNSPTGVAGSWADLHTTTDPLARSYAHTGIGASTEMFYQVAVMNENHLGEYSDAVSATTETTPRPLPPTGLTATAGAEEITLNWTPPVAVADAPVTHYVIETSADGSDPWTAVGEPVADAATSTFLHTDLGGVVTRHYRVIARAAEGDSPPSETASATSRVGGLPLVPTGVSATGGAGAIDLSWTAPTDTSTGRITGFEIELSANDIIGWSVLVTVEDPQASTYSHAPLPAATIYFYRVRTQNRFGLSEPSDVVVAQVSGRTAQDPTIDDVRVEISANGVLDSADATILYYAFIHPKLLGDGTETGPAGIPRYREVFLQPLVGPPGTTTTDLELQAILRAVNDLTNPLSTNRPADINQDNTVDAADALIMYYTLTLGELVGDGSASSPHPGFEQYRRILIHPYVATGRIANDTEYRLLIQRVHSLKDRLDNR